MIYRNFFSPVAPSRSAASYKEYGISRVAAVIIVKVYPKFLQTVTIMITAIAYVGSDIKLGITIPIFLSRYASIPELEFSSIDHKILIAVIEQTYGI